MRKHREYDNNYPSVTQILDVLRKVGLEMWFKMNTLEFITEKSKKGKEIGTHTHEAIHQFIETGKAKIESQYAEEVVMALKSFMLFRKDHPEMALNNAEMPLTSEIYRFNGTIDCIGQKDGKIIIADWKTGEAKEKDAPTIYDEYKYQVSAYVNLYNEVNKCNVTEALIVSVAKDKEAYGLYTMNEEEIKSRFNEVFLSALKIKNYQRKEK